MSTMENVKRDFLAAPAFMEEREALKLRADPHFYRTAREILLRRQTARREQLEHATGEAAIVMRGRSQELTSIINDLFPPMAKED